MTLTCLRTGHFEGELPYHSRRRQLLSGARPGCGAKRTECCIIQWSWAVSVQMRAINVNHLPHAQMRTMFISPNIVMTPAKVCRSITVATSFILTELTVSPRQVHPSQDDELILIPRT